MKIKLLSQKHNQYKGDLYTKYQALYEGGELFHTNIKHFLTRSGLETDAMYERRCKEACYQPYINSIVDQFSSQLFACPFVIRTDPASADEFYSSFKEDIDPMGSGQDLNNFMRDCFTASLVKGCAWILAERPAGEDLPDNLLDYQASGLDIAWLRQVKSENVFDWETDANGQLLWVITYQREMRRDNPRLERKVVTDTWKIYDRAEVETFSVSYDSNNKPNQDTEVPSIGKRAHGFTRVPLICLQLPKGLWLVNRLADAQVEHFRMDNTLGWAMRRACYPTAVYKTDDDDKGGLVSSVDGFAIKIGSTESFSWEGAPVDSFQVIAERVKTFKDEIHRLALQMSLAVDNTPGTMKRSGDSKAMDAQSTEICLHAYASVIKASVEEIFELISDARGDLGLTFDIAGMDQFNVLDMQGLVTTAKLAQGLDIPSDTFRKELAAKVAESMLPNVSQETKDKIKEEILSAQAEEPQPAPEPQEEGADPKDNQ